VAIVIISNDAKADILSNQYFDSVCNFPPKVTSPLGTSLARFFKPKLADYPSFSQEVSDSIHQAPVVSEFVFK
jgi:hypothetical protein